MEEDVIEDLLARGGRHFSIDQTPWGVWQIRRLMWSARTWEPEWDVVYETEDLMDLRVKLILYRKKYQ